MSARSKPPLVCRLLGLLACALLHSGHARATPKGEGGAKGLSLFPSQNSLVADGKSQPWLRRHPAAKARPNPRQRAREALESSFDPTRRHEEEDEHHPRYLLSKPSLGVVKTSETANVGSGDLAGAVESGALAVSVILDIKRDRVAKKDGSRPYRAGVGLGLGRLGLKVRTEF